MAVGAASVSEDAVMPAPKKRKQPIHKPPHEPWAQQQQQGVMYGAHMRTSNVTTSNVLTPDQIVANRQ